MGLKRDEQGIVRKIHHFGQPYAPEDSTSLVTAMRAGAVPTPRQIADEYLRDVLPLFGINEAMTDNLSGIVGSEPLNEEAKLRHFDEEEVGRQIVVSYRQTHLGLPVWQAGIAVKLAGQPYRVISSQSSVQSHIQVSPPSSHAPYLPEQLDARTLARLLGLGEGRELTIHDVQLLIYRFDPDDRGNATGEHDHNDETQMHVCGPSLQLPELSAEITPGQYYVVCQALFALSVPGPGDLNWSALVEPQTGAILRLDSFIGCIDGFVYLRDPLTKTGNASVRPNSATATLDSVRDRVRLDGLSSPISSFAPQELRGEFVHLRDVSSPPIQPPTEPRGDDFLYSVPTNNFSAVNAYYHCDRLFRMLEEMGFNVRRYFNGTTFPVSVDHRISYGTPPTSNVVNASAPGNSSSNGSDGFRFALVQRNTNVGMAVEWRVILHEFGHTILWDHLNSPNFFFAHSPGDALAAILNDPGSSVPDRFVTFPWTPITRRHDRRVQDGWGWGGRMDSPTRVGIPGTRDAAGYDREQILSSSLFRYYRAIGGDHSDPDIQTKASRYTAFIIFLAVGALSSLAPPRNAEDFVDELMDADLSTDEFEGLAGGTTHKVIRWAFEQQGLYQPFGAPTPVTQSGAPPLVDVYIDDGRKGEYDPQPSFIFRSTDIWNRRASDNELVHQPPVANQANFLYVRVKNRGNLQANNVVVSAFASSERGDRLWPSQWSALDTASVLGAGPISPQGEIMVGPFEWTPRNIGSVAIMASVSADRDPSNADSVAREIPIARLAHCDNNIAGRVMNVVGGEDGLVGEVAIASIQPRLTIPDADPIGVVSELRVKNSGNIDQLSVSLTIVHTHIGDLLVRLSSPSGTTLVLFEGQGESTDNLNTTFSSNTLSALASLRGEIAAGIW